MSNKLKRIYEKLYAYFGPQDWWPAETSLEVAIGAILTQSTSWKNVELAINNLKEAGCLSFHALSKINTRRLAQLIRPAGYYNVKAKRLKNFIQFLNDSYGGNIASMKKKDADILRHELLLVNGIGQETADSILLYALDKPVFVVDTYTKRICVRHNLIGSNADYDSVQKIFIKALPLDVKLFNEYHALIVRLAKEFCLKKKGKCDECPVKGE